MTFALAKCDYQALAVDVLTKQDDSEGMGIPGWEHIERNDELIAKGVIGTKAQAMQAAQGALCIACKQAVTNETGGPMSPDQSTLNQHAPIWAHHACMQNVPRFAPASEVLAAVSPCVREVLTAYRA